MENTNTNTTYVHWNVHHGFQIIIQFLLGVEGGGGGGLKGSRS